MAFTPSRLAVARARRGLTKRKLAEAARLSERIVAAYENPKAEAAPQPDTLERIARVLRFPVKFFERPEIDMIAPTGASFRAMSRMTAAQRGRALASGALAFELYEWLQEGFVLPEVDVPNLRPEKNPESAAQQLRIHWALGEGSVGNMIALLESKGIRVFSLAEEYAEVDAFSLWRDDQPFMFMNTFKSAEHSRFDAGHELAHLVLHRHGQPGREAEREADAFASAFLMPANSVKNRAPRLATLDRLVAAKHEWGVSLAALVYRMHTVGMLTDWYYERLFVEIGKRGFRTSEPEPLPREFSRVLETVFEELRKDGITRSDIAATLDWPIAELNALIFQIVVSGVPSGPTNRGMKPRTAGSGFPPGQLRLLG